MIQQKETENKLFVSFVLSTAFDLDGCTLPKRRALRYNCVWVYRGEGCGYSGGPVANAKDEPTTVAAEDVCGKRLASCRLRFPAPAPAPMNPTCPSAHSRGSIFREVA